MIAAVVIVTLTLVSLMFSHSMIFAAQAQEFKHKAELAAVVAELNQERAGMAEPGYAAAMTAWKTSKKKAVTYGAKRDAAAAAGNVVSVAMSFEPMLSTWIQQHYLYQRNPEYMSLVADKVKVKEIVSRLSLPGVSIPKTLWAGPKCSDLTLERLPASYVIKSNHASGQVMRIKEGIDLATKQPVSLQRVRGICEGWLAVKYAAVKGEMW